MKKTLLKLFLSAIAFVFSNASTAQSNYSLDFAINEFIKDADVFKSTAYGWTFVKSSGRYFFRTDSGSPFVEILDPKGYLTHSAFYDGFNATKYQGDKYGSLFTPGPDGFIVARNLGGSPEVASVIRVNFSTKTIIESQSATTPLLYISSFIQYDNNIYFRARSKDNWTAVYKLTGDGWEITSGTQFFKDYEVGSQYVFDEENNRLVMSTGLTYQKTGIWSYKNGAYAELDDENKANEFDVDKFLGFIYESPTHKGIPVMLGKYIKNDVVGNEIYVLDGGSVGLITDASLDDKWTSVYRTVFNDHFELFLEASLLDYKAPNNSYSSKNGRGVYRLNLETGTLQRLTNPTDNIYSVSHAVRTKDGVYLAAKSSNSATTYNIYLYKDGNPVLQKIDLKGEYLASYNAGLFVSDDIVYFVSNKGLCKITNTQFENFYESSDYWGQKSNEILLVENNKIYLNYYYDSGFYVYSPNTLSINEVPQANEIAVYPNPSSDFIWVENKENVSRPTYTILNVLGQQISTGKLTGETTKLEISHLSSGPYLLKIDGEQASKSLKFIKR